jgi:hypothetical protein
MGSRRWVNLSYMETSDLLELKKNSCFKENVVDGTL